MVSGIVDKQMDFSLLRIQRLNRRQERNRADGINGQNLQHAASARFQINRAVDIEPVASAVLLDDKRRFFRSPTADRAHAMRRMHRVAKQHRFIIRQAV